MIKSTEKFWIEDITQLFTTKPFYNLNDFPNHSYGAQLNLITRFILILSIIFLFVKFEFGIYFFLFALLFIIIIYFIIKKEMNSLTDKNTIIENFGPTSSGVGILPSPPPPVLSSLRPVGPTGLLLPTVKSIGDGVSIGNPASSTTTCTPLFNLDDNGFNNPNFESANQPLAGCPNPKTFVHPVIAPPLASSDYWKPNDFVYPRGINAQGNLDLYHSGYISNEGIPCTDCYDDICTKTNLNEFNMCNGPKEFLVETKPQILENYEVPTKIQGGQGPSPYIYKGDCNQGGCGRASKICDDETFIVNENLPSDYVLAPFKYDPEQLLKHNIPSNLPAGPAQQSDNLNCYNKNLHTSIIQPGVYTRAETIESVNGNLGISYTQQFQPVTCEKKDGETNFISHDPKLVNQFPPEKVEVSQIVTETDIFDPRLTGYGTSYRSYVDNMTGQVRYYYDDVDAIRQPNYLTRNKIDFTEFGSNKWPNECKRIFGRSGCSGKSSANFYYINK